MAGTPEGIYQNRGILNPDRRRGLGLIAGVCFAAFGLSVVRCAQPSVLPSTPLVKITYPENRFFVNANEDIGGIVDRLPEGYKIWVLLRRERTNEFHPQREPVTLLGDPPSSWFLNSARFADPGRSVEPVVFFVHAVMTDSSATGMLMQYLQKGEKEGYRGLLAGELTLGGVKWMDSVFVYLLINNPKDKPTKSLQA